MRTNFIEGKTKLTLIFGQNHILHIPMNRYKAGIDMSGGITNDKRISVNIF